MCPGWGAAFAGEAECPCRSCLTLGARLPSPSVSTSATTLERTEQAQKGVHFPLCLDGRMLVARVGEPLSAAPGREPGSRPARFATGLMETRGGKHRSRGSASLHAGSGCHGLCPHPRS